jgi:hypothetical protein
MWKAFMNQAAVCVKQVRTIQKVISLPRTLIIIIDNISFSKAIRTTTAIDESVDYAVIGLGPFNTL